MKKLFKTLMLAAVIFFTAAPSEIFAADIVVRAVKIKKKNPKANNNDFYKNTAHANLDVSGATMTTTTSTTYVKGGGTVTNTELSFAFTVDIQNNDSVKTANLRWDGEYSDGKTAGFSITPTYNEKTGQYEGGKGISLDGIVFPKSSGTITLTNSKGDSAFFEMTIKKDKEKNNDSCNTKFKLKEVTYETANVSGLYTFQFSFNFANNSDTPDVVSMIVQLTDCNGQTMNIKVKLYYDANSGTYGGGNTIKQDKSCKWFLNYGEVYAANPCGDETTFAIDFDQSKTNGTGTRDGAASTKGAKPKLK